MSDMRLGLSISAEAEVIKAQPADGTEVEIEADGQQGAEL